MHGLLTERVEETFLSHRFEKKKSFIVVYCRAKYCIKKYLMAASNSESSLKSMKNSNEQSNISIPHNQQPVGTQEAQDKLPAREGEDHGENGRRTPQGQRLVEHTVRDDEGEKSPVDHDEDRQLNEKDDESGKMAQQHDRFANQRGGSPEQGERFEQPAVQNQARVGNGGRFSKNDEQLMQTGRFHANAEVAQDGKYRLDTPIFGCIKYSNFRRIQCFCERTLFR